MKLDDIQNKLNSLFSGSHRKIVFWYDDDVSYSDDIDMIKLPDNCKLIKLTGSNYFAVKLLLEHEDISTNYLVYAPFPRPEDRNNPLADTYHYSEHFYSDKLVQLMGDLGISPEYQDIIKEYKKFWSDANCRRFQDLGIGNLNKETIELGLLCVLAGVKTASVDEMIRKTVLAGINENAILNKYASMKIDHAFWSICENVYGYKDPNPSIDKFLATMLFTYIDVQMDGNEPDSWKRLLTKKRNDALIFIKNLMNNEESREFYDSFAEQASKELCVSETVKKVSLDNVLSCDAMKEFDENIIDWIISKLENRTIDEKISGMTIPEICETRAKIGYHYAPLFCDHYKMLEAAYYLLKEISTTRYQATIVEAVNEYVDCTYLIDTYYRKFYYYIDRIGLSKKMETLRELVENMYTNKYLTDFAYKWNLSLTDEAYDTYPDVRQEDFFEHFVRPYMKESGGGRVVVIVSDGLRYECARELMDNLDLDEKCDASIFHMLSTLPSETTLGMAALLPNKDIQVDEKLEIHVDNIHCGNSSADRLKILQTAVPKSAVYSFDTIMQTKQADIREMFQDKDLIYIYHNQVDQRGEGMKSDNEVFNACQEAIAEIQTMIHRLTGYISNTRYLVTADHGFIYKRDKLSESDKIKTDLLSVGLKNKRYLLSNYRLESEALITRSMGYLSKLNNTYVITPLGADIIKMPGGGQNYVHGGSSLQEMIVPVIKVNTYKGKQDTDFVNVELSCFSHRITSIEVKLDFMQMEPVTDTIKPRRLQAFFVDSCGDKISYPVPIIANSKSSEAKDRLIQERFTLKSGHYNRSQEYYLVIADQEDETIELQRYKFEIDISDMAY